MGLFFWKWNITSYLFILNKYSLRIVASMWCARFYVIYWPWNHTCYVSSLLSTTIQLCLLMYNITYNETVISNPHFFFLSKCKSTQAYTVQINVTTCLVIICRDIVWPIIQYYFTYLYFYTHERKKYYAFYNNFFLRNNNTNNKTKHNPIIWLP